MDLGDPADPVDRTPGERVHTLSTDGSPRVRDADLLREQLPRADAGVRQGRRGVPGGAGEQRVLRDHGGVRATPADEPDARGGGRPVGRERRRLGHQRVRRSHGRVVSQVGLFQHRDPATHGPFIRRHHAVRPMGGLVPVALARGRGRHGAGAPPALGRPARSGAPVPGPIAGRWSILPTYEERDTIEWVLARLLDVPEHVDVLVVDDSSPDGTGELVRAVAAEEPRVTAARAPGEGRARRARTWTASASVSRTATTCSSRWTRTCPTRPRSSATPRGGRFGPGPGGGEPIRPGWLRHRLEPLARGAVEGRATSTPA